MNWGRTLSLSMAGADLVISLAYLFHKDVRMTLYWFFAACLTATISW